MSNHCTKCGKEIGTTTSLMNDNVCINCKNAPVEKSSEGWVCPTCKRSISPNVVSCPFCRPQTESGNMMYQGKTILIE